MVAVKNSMKRLPAFSPASAMTAGRIGPEGAATVLCVRLASSLGMVYAFRRVCLAGLGRPVLEDATAVRIACAGVLVSGVLGFGVLGIDATVVRNAIGFAVERSTLQNDVHLIPFLRLASKLFS